MDLLQTLSLNSFSSIWYWIITSIAWSVSCHITLGVPYDVLVRAHNKGGAAAQDVEMLVQVHGRRMRGVFGSSTARVIGVLIFTFVMAVLGTFGFYFNYELAAAMFVLIGPLTLVQVLGVVLAFRIEAEGLMGTDLRKAILRRRFWNQVIGLLSIMTAAMVAFITFVRGTVVWY